VFFSDRRSAPSLQVFNLGGNQLVIGTLGGSISTQISRALMPIETRGTARV
jgi:hypothetical protein